MARVEIYNGHSSIIPILIHTSDLGGSIKIKEEPLDHDENNDEHSLPDATIDKPETTFDKKIQNHAETKVNFLNNIATSNVKYATAGSLSSCKNNSKNHVDNSKIISINSIKSYNDQDQTEFGNDIIDMRLRTRTRSNIVECDICYVICADQTALRAHKSRYNKVNLVCHICKLSFMTPIHLTSHRRSVHRGVDWRCYIYECHYCKLGFRKKHILQQHIFHYHNINESFINKRSRCRPKNRSIKRKRISLNSKSRQNKRKCTTPIITNDSEKKLAISSKTNETILQYEDEKNQFNNDEQINNVIELQQSTSISDCQNDYNKSLNSSKFLINPPLVKICAVPNEVETLLNDCDETDDSFSVISNSSDDSNYSVMTDIFMDDYLPKKYSLRSRTVNNISYDETQNYSTEQKWEMLQKHFECRDCRIELKKLSLPLSDNDKLSNEIMDYTNTKNDETIQINSRPTVGMELKNLDLALKKLQDVNHKQDKILNNDTLNLPGDSKILNESINNENSSSSQATIIEDITTNKIVYMSSLCQTRYTTKKKLIFHYLCFHTNPRYQDCAVCRSQYTNIAELTDHLSQHCIEIPESQNEKSPLDPKGPCENCKEKYTCKGCKMKFWLVSNLRDHEQHCPLADKIKINNASNNVNVNEGIVVDKPSASDNSTEEKQNDVIVAADCSTKSSESIDTSSLTQQYYQKNGDTEQVLICEVCRSSFKTILNLDEHIRKFSLRRMKSYYCNRCGTPFPSPSLLSAHTRAAHLPESSIYKIHCTICQQGFNEKRTLRQHMMHIHREELKIHADDVPKAYCNLEKTCGICKTIFSDRKRFIEHSMYYYDDETIECSMCGEQFLGRYKAHAHTKNVHYSSELRQGYSYCCSICLEGFVYPSHLYSHMYHVHNTEIQYEQNIHVSEIKHNNQHGLFYMCRICHETFDTPTLLTDHHTEYSNIGDYSCSKCRRKFQTNLLLDRHIELSHSGQTHVGQIECHSCHEILQSKSSWLCHLKHFHINANTNNRPSEMWQRNDNPSSKSSKDSCAAPLSGNNSTSENEINKNVNAVINDTSSNEDSRASNQTQIEYTCALCDMKFINSSELKTHSLKFGNTCVNNTGMVNTNFSIASIYSVELEDYENLCDTKDDDINKIKNDEEIKVSEVKEIAEEQQKNENNLNAMSKILSEKKFDIKFPCQKCHLNFTTHGSLRKHEILYSNSGDYECNICQRKFKFIGHYQTHYKKHENRQRETNTPVHYCKTCDEKFVSESSRNCHFAHIHGILLKTRPLSVSNLPRRSSPRQSKPSLQTNLDSFLSRNSTIGESKELNKTNHNLEINVDVIRENQMLTDESTTNINSNIILNPMAQQNSLENIHKDNSTISKNPRKITNLSIIPDVIPANIFQEPIKIVKTNKQIVEEHEIVDVENEIVEIGGELINKEKEITVDDEIIEFENESVDKNSSELCDICGDAFINRQELINHQKNSHNVEMISEQQNNIQSEFIDIESIIEDEDENENNNLATNFDNTDIDIIFDSTRACDDDVHVDENGDANDNVNQRCAIVHPIMPEKTYIKKNRLECKICHMKFPNLYKLGEHLEEQHQTDSSSEIDNIQNPRVSSSSKFVHDIKLQNGFRHLQLCCKFCNKQFSNDQYLIAHIKNTHSALINFKVSDKSGKIVIGHQTKSNAISNESISIQENLITIDNVQQYSRDTKIINYTKDSTPAIGKGFDVIKKSNDGIVLRKIILKQDSDVPQNSIISGPTRFPRLVQLPRNTLIIPFNRQTTQKTNQHYHNDVPR